MPFPAWLLAKRFKANSFLKQVNFPVMLSGVSYIPPANGINYTSWFLAAFIFRKSMASSERRATTIKAEHALCSEYLMRRFRFRWWSKYNFVTSAALDSGTASSAILIFALLQLPKSGALRPNWWGNTVYRQTYDWLGYPFKIP